MTPCNSCEDCDATGKCVWGNNLGEPIYIKCESCNGTGYITTSQQPSPQPVSSEVQEAYELLSKYIKEAENTMALKKKCADEGNDWVVPLQTISCRELISLKPIITELERQLPSVVTVEELSQEYVDAVYAAFPTADLNRHSAIAQDFLHFVKRFKPNGIKLSEDK